MREDLVRARGYTKGIAGDELSLKISSYPSTADYLARRLKGHGDTVCELCCGVGVSLVALANTFQHVIGVDIDEKVLANCDANLKAASVQRYTLVMGDVIDPSVLKRITADVVLYDIPYWSNHAGKVDAAQNPDLTKLVDAIRKNITRNIVIYAPPHFSYEDARQVLGECEYAQIYTNGKHDRNFVFLGDIIEHSGTHRIEL